jgi:hypothetical protein
MALEIIMDKEVKEIQSEQVRYHKRMAAGAWLDGEEMGEKGSATMPEANSDHGKFTTGIDKKNA